MGYKVLDAEGKEITLTNEEARRAVIAEKKIKNDLGYDVAITTLTTIMKKISMQKFFEIAPADYLPVRVGQGAWSDQLLTYLSYSMAGDFATGLLNTGANNARLAAADAGISSLSIKVNNWAKSIGWSIMDLEQASKAGNWDIVSAKEESRKRNWDLGIQKVAFLGLAGDSQCLGLYNQAGITTNTSVITKAISTMTPDELKIFTNAILAVYRANSAYAAWPTHFIMPESDYLGLAGSASADFPVKSVLQLLEETFQTMTMNKGFKILPNAYGNAANNSLGVQRYILLNYDEASLRMDIPVDYTNTLANSVDNFSFQNVGYGQFTGVLAYRPLELMYFQY